MSKHVAVAALLLCSLLGGARPTRASETLTALDYQEIQQLYARYNFAIDAADAQAYAALFVPDGVFNTYTGHDALVAFIKGRPNTNLRHWNTNLMITGTPEGANGAVYLMLLDVGVNPPVVSRAAKYEDTLVKTANGWRFKKRSTRTDGVPPTPR
jgi:hypothetical protein